MISAITATDMTFHFSLKDELDACITRNRPADVEPVPQLRGQNNRASISTTSQSSMPAYLASDKDREILLKTLLHIADISNPAKIFELSKHWSDLVITEFFEQVSNSMLHSGSRELLISGWPVGRVIAKSEKICQCRRIWIETPPISPSCR